MDNLLFKSFCLETFLSFSILFLLIYNVVFLMKKENNVPLIDSELISQISFILIACTLILLNTNFYGSLSNNLFFNDLSTIYIKIIVLIFSWIVLYIIKQSYIYQKLNHFEYLILFIFSILSLFLMISSRDLISFYLSMEMQSLCFYILSAFKKNSTFSVESGLKYFIMGSVVSGIFLFGSSLLYGTMGTLSLPYIHLIISDCGIFLYSNELYIIYILGCLFILSTLLFKLTCAPFHIWAPDVYEGAPITSTIIISTIPKIGIIYFLIRWFSSTPDMIFSIFLICCGMFSNFIGTLYAFGQKRIKRLIIYSSIGQIGFIICSISINNYEGYFFGWFYLIIYLLTSLLLWGHIISFYLFQSKFNSIKSLHLSHFTNLFYYNKYWSFNLLIALLSLGGIPPLVGFLSKFFILFEVIKYGAVKIAIFLIITSSVSVYYYIRLIKLMYFEPNVKDTLQIFPVYFDNKLNYCYLLYSLLIVLIIMLFFYPLLLLLSSEYLFLLSIDTHINSYIL